MNFKSTTIEDLSVEMGELQQEITKELESASMAGDLDKVQELSLQIAGVSEKFQERMEWITSGAGSGIEDENRSPYTEIPCEADLDLVVYDGDRDYFMEFCKDEQIQKAYQEMVEQNPDSTSRKTLLKNSLRLTRVLAPSLYEIGDRCKDVLGLNRKIEFYVYQSDSFNAACYPPDGDRLYIMVSSALIEKFDHEELLFVIGHEIGHAIFLHHKFPASSLMELGEAYLSPLHAMKLFAWKRNAEVSADRVGMLCCQDFEAAGRTFFKLSSGITAGAIDFKLKEYIKQFVDLEKVLEDSEVDPEDWYSTHPFSPLRIKALEVFKDSETYHTLIGKEGGTISEVAMEETIAKMMSLMEPIYLSGNTKHGDKIQKFIFWAGYLIAIADGEVYESEIEALSSIVDSDIFSELAQELEGKDEDSVAGIVADMARDINALLSPMQKLNILRDLSIISAADGDIDLTEVGMLYGVAMLLSINTDFIDRVISDMEDED